MGVFLFTVFSFLRICSSVKHASLRTRCHITVFMFLHVRTTFNYDLFSVKSYYISFVEPSQAFKFKSLFDSTDFPWLWVKKRDSLTGQFCMFHAETNSEKLRPSLRFVRKGIAATKHADLNKNSYAVSYAFDVSFLLLHLVNHVECWIHVLIAHLLLTAGKKMSLDKSLQIHAKSWKITFKPWRVLI